MSTDIEYNGVYKENDQTQVVIEGGAPRPNTLTASKSSKSFFKTAPKTGGKNTRISLSDIPPELTAKLKHLDLGNDGYLDIEDILVLDEKEQHDKKTTKFYRRLFIVLVVVFLLQIAAVFAVSFAAIKASKDTYVTNNVLQTKSGAPVQTASVDYCTTSSGMLTLRNPDKSCPLDPISKPPAIETAISTVTMDLSNDLSSTTLSELRSLYLVSPTGAEVFVNVKGYIRTDANDLTLITDIGDLTVTGSQVSFTDTTPEKYFKLAGISTLSIDGTSNRRILASISESPSKSPSTSPSISTSKSPSISPSKLSPSKAVSKSPSKKTTLSPSVPSTTQSPTVVVVVNNSPCVSPDARARAPTV